MIRSVTQNCDTIQTMGFVIRCPPSHWGWFVQWKSPCQYRKLITNYTQKKDDNGLHNSNFMGVASGEYVRHIQRSTYDDKKFK